MRKLLPFTLVLTLLSCCAGHLPAPASPITKCVVPAAPYAPDIRPYGCGEQNELVCLTMEDTKKLVVWINDMIEVELAVEACNLVERTAPPAK